MSPDDITIEQFENKLIEIVDRSPASHLLFVPGVYEFVAEHFNNDVIEEILKEAKS